MQLVEVMELSTVSTKSTQKRESEGEATEMGPLEEEFEERAAILEYDAGMSREDAEEEARRITGYEGW